jgi:hypothetical protein
MKVTKYEFEDENGDVKFSKNKNEARKAFREGKIVIEHRTIIIYPKPLTITILISREMKNINQI